MLFKIILIVVILELFCCAEGRDDGQRNGVLKRGTLNDTNQDLKELKDVVKALKKRIKDLESKRGWCKDGTPGANGTPGAPGMPGKPGKDGNTGSPGPRGRDGRDGQHGVAGPRGSPGLQGPRGAQGPRGSSGAGIQYVRWGRTSCPSGANLVYKGRVGGEYYAHQGGGSNYVCLTESPKYQNYKSGTQKWSAYMYGAEYQTRDTDSHDPFPANTYEYDVPCAVCFVPNRNAKLMIPATNECPAGWSREFWGYLMTERHTHANPKDFICVDRNAEAVGSSRNDNGALLYTVEGRCGSLPCPPFVEGQELICAVCTK